MLEFRDVVKRYTLGGETIRAVDGVTLSVVPGEILALFGPSGSGKTTLLLLAAGLLSPDTGTVRFNGRDLGELSEIEAADYRLRELGFVFQLPQLLPMSVEANAAIGLFARGLSRRAAIEEVRPILERVGLAKRARHLPHQLSGGERQRVVIARALALGPRLILADEPTGSLDRHRGEEVLKLLREQCAEHGVGVLLVTHDPRAADHADRVATMEDGRIATLDGPDPALGPDVRPSSPPLSVEERRPAR